MVDDRCAMATSCGSLNNKMAVLEVLIIFLKSLKFSVLVSFRGCFFAQIWNLNITTSLPLKCGLEQQKDHLPKMRKRLGTG